MITGLSSLQQISTTINQQHGLVSVVGKAAKLHPTKKQMRSQYSERLVAILNEILSELDLFIDSYWHRPLSESL